MKSNAAKPGRETLRRLYEDERLATRRIGEIYGVAHITVRRWLAGYEIPVRPSGRGLANRGTPEPARDELFDLVHVQGLSYRVIAARFGVDFTAVPHWLDRHGIRKPTLSEAHLRGRESKLPSIDELRHRRHLGESVTSIATSRGVSRRVITGLCKDNGIPVDRDGWKGGRRLPCIDGHEARSVYEQRVDNWLTEHRLSHQVEPRYPFDSRYKADFRVGDTYIEIWGVKQKQAYNQRKADKIARCQEAEIPLIGINWWQFAGKRRWWQPFENLLIESPAHYLF